MKTPPPVVTTDFLYLRLIGDRSIQEKDFGRIQIDRVVEMQKWGEAERIRLAIVTANNHNMLVLGPGTVNMFRNILGLPGATWQDEGDQQEQRHSALQDSKQSTLSDFLS